jgi:hypothetical protein
MNYFIQQITFNFKSIDSYTLMVISFNQHFYLIKLCAQQVATKTLDN